MDQYVCPPWFECRCVLGKPVAKSTMLAHRRAANAKRVEMGLPLFGWGSKVDSDTDLYTFDCFDSLAEHQSDNAAQPIPIVASQLCEEPRCTFQGMMNSENLYRSENINEENREFHDIGDFENMSVHVNTSMQQAFSDLEAASCHSVPRDIQEVPLARHQSLDQQDLISIGHQPSSPSLVRSNSSIDEELESVSPASIATLADSDENDDIGAAVNENENEQQPGFNAEDPLLRSMRIFELLPWLVENQRWVNLANRHALDEAVMDEILDILNAPCKQWKTAISSISKAAGLKDEVQEYPMCPGHMAFVPCPETGLVPKSCSECGNSIPDYPDCDSIYQYLPLVPRIRKTVASSKSCEALFEYRRTRVPDQHNLRDYFDGASYQRLCEKFDGEGNLINDVFVLASTDGFAPFKNRRYDMWTLVAITFNFPPDQRYLPQNVLPLALIPGPLQPKNLQSFILPLVNELREASQGVLMRFPDGSSRSVRVHLVCFTGDQPAVCKVSGPVGPNGRSPCRDCKIQGYYSNHYYFPSRIKISATQTRMLFNTRNLPKRIANETLIKIREIESESGVSRKTLQINSGICKSSVLFYVPNVLPYVSFPHDVMHTFYNIQKELLRILFGDFQDDFSIGKSQVDSLDAELKHWKYGISSQLAPQPLLLSRWKNWKAADHKRFSIMYSIVIFDGILPQLYLGGVQMFSEIVDICTRGEVTKNDVDQLEKRVFKFYEHFERHYFKYREDRVDFCKSVFHILLHLADCMRNFGPLIGVSQYWLEGHIGWMGGRNSCKNRPAQSMFKNALFSESLKRFYDVDVFWKVSDVHGIVDVGGYVFSGGSKITPLQSMSDHGRQIRGLISDYLCRKYDMSESQSREVVSTLTAVEFYPRVKYVSCNETQTYAAFLNLGGKLPKQTRSRPSCFIAVEMENENASFDEVWYGRLLRVMGFNISCGNTETLTAKHEVVMIDWARTLCKGSQGQVYTNGRLTSAFSGATVEDATVIKRLVGVVEHSVPRSSASGNERVARRTHTRTYFLDDAIRIDHLLSTRTCSVDGKNRILRGFQR